MLDGVQKALADDIVKAIVVVGKGRTFPAGADIREFSAPPQGKCSPLGSGFRISSPWPPIHFGADGKPVLAV